jgi:tRNA A-37 threonylcarbamoyl transferase component Bud32
MSTSNHPEEIEEGEIAPLPESGSEYETESESAEEISMTEDEVDELDGMGDEDDMFEDEGVDVATLMTSLLATDEGDTVCTALLGITQQLQVQNKILIKILSEMKN